MMPISMRPIPANVAVAAFRVLAEGCDEVIQTSCAVVILKGVQAYKLKKAVDFGFLDFTTIPKRHSALANELDYNQATAPDIYQRLEEIEGEPVLVMRRFDTSGVLAEQCQSDPPSPEILDRLGSTIAQFHARAEVERDASHAINTYFTIEANRRNIDLFREALGSDQVDTYDRVLKATCERLAPVLQVRFDAGWIRRCHGDLHLGNILIEADQPILFDCIEFNERLIRIDILYDLAFLLMDLWVRGHKSAANRVMNAWLEAMARLELDKNALYAGLDLLPLYLAIRAGIRCHVHAHAGGEDNMARARGYLQAGIEFLKPISAKAVAVGGLSGSGKSTHAREIAAKLGRPAGAVILRSDEIRKRQWGCAPLESLPPQAYSPETSQGVYEEIYKAGAIILNTGQSVIFDATFREASRRAEVGGEIGRLGYGFEGLWLDVPLEVRLARVAVRQKDVSDATTDTVRQQGEVTPDDWRLIRP